MNKRKILLGKTLEELKSTVSELNLPAFTAKQIADWLYVKRVNSFDLMTNLSKKARESLNENYEVGRIPYAQKMESVDGTKKYLFPVTRELRGCETMGIEAVMIPNAERKTICVSSQVGCKMACVFCMTGRQGFHGNLTAGEIISQFMDIDDANELTNAVFMGMGEPLDNYSEVIKAIEILTAPWGFAWSPKRITVSTIGVLPSLKRFLEESKCHIAISIHNAFPTERQSLMPLQKKYNIEDIVALLKNYDFTGQRRVSFEYIMFDGVNDTKQHADAMIKLLRGMECRINLIRFHQIPDCSLKTSSQGKIDLFQKRLNSAGLTTTLRHSMGEDILAACGMLAGKK